MKVVKIQSRLGKIGWQTVDEIVYSSNQKSKDDKNDVSIISEAALAESKRSLEKGFCHNRFQPNLVISMNNMEEEQMKANVELDIEDVKLFVLNKTHHCHENCPLFRINRHSCGWIDHVHYACVKRGGKVRRGSAVSMITP